MKDNAGETTGLDHFKHNIPVWGCEHCKREARVREPEAEAPLLLCYRKHPYAERASDQAWQCSYGHREEDDHWAWKQRKVEP